MLVQKVRAGCGSLDGLQQLRDGRQRHRQLFASTRDRTPAPPAPTVPPAAAPAVGAFDAVVAALSPERWAVQPVRPERLHRNQRHMYGTSRLNFHRFDRFELDLRGHTQPQGAAVSCLRLEWADMVLI